MLYGVSDLTAAASWLEDSFGLAPIGGGVHPGWGTANAIVPVGNRQYVELIAVVDRDSKHPLALALSAMIADGDRPVGLCLRSADLDDTARRLDLQVADGARTNPDGAAAVANGGSGSNSWTRTAAVLRRVARPRRQP